MADTTHMSHTMGRIEALLIEVLATQPWFWEVAGRRVAVFVANEPPRYTATRTRVLGSVAIVVDHAPELDFEPVMPSFGSVERETRRTLIHEDGRHRETAAMKRRYPRVRMHIDVAAGVGRTVTLPGRHPAQKPRSRRRRGGVRD